MNIAIGGQKGGTGKTTTATAIAAELVARKQRVLLVDADPQATTSRWSALAGALGNATPITMIATDVHLHEKVRQVMESFDSVVVDLPPRLDEVQKSALLLVDLVVLTCGDSATEAWALHEATKLVRAAQELRQENRMPRLDAVALLTRIDSRTTLGREARGILTRGGVEVLQAQLHARVAYKEALAAGLGVAQYAPNDPAGAEVRALVDELMRRTDGPRTKAYPHHRAAAARRARR